MEPHHARGHGLRLCPCCLQWTNGASPKSDPSAMQYMQHEKVHCTACITFISCAQHAYRLPHVTAVDACRKPYRKSLTRQYFAVAFSNPSEQFFYFTSLVRSLAWLAATHIAQDEGMQLMLLISSAQSELSQAEPLWAWSNQLLLAVLNAMPFASSIACRTLCERWHANIA